MLASSGVRTHIIVRAAIYRSLVRLLRRKVTLPQDKTQPYDWGISTKEPRAGPRSRSHSYSYASADFASGSSILDSSF
jgi:hypothetical protein